MSKCAGGFDLPEHGPCPECGAGPSDGCYRANAKTFTELEQLRQQAAKDKAEIEALRKDKERLDYLQTKGEAYGFEDIHEGNRWTIEGPFMCVRDGIDAAIAAK